MVWEKSHLETYHIFALCNLEKKIVINTSINPSFLSDEKLQLITGQIFVGQAILVAYELGLFRLISHEALSIGDLALRLGVKKRAAQAMVSCACALDLVDHKDDGYELSSIGKMYLDDKNPEYYGKVLDLLIQENEIMNYSNIKRALLSDRSQVIGEKDLFSDDDSLTAPENFVAALHQKAFKPAFYWSKSLNLREHKKFIDVGGGSGIHTIAACLNNPWLSGIVCDRPSVAPHRQDISKISI